MRGVALITALAACTSPPAPAPPEPAPPAEPAPPRALAAAALACPIRVPGTSLHVEDTDDGAAMVFVTSGDVASLRSQIFAMADLHNRIFAALTLPPEPATKRLEDDPVHASGPGPRPRSRLTGDTDERDLVVLVPSTARVESIGGGARLVFATDAAEVDALRAEVRGEADAIEDACAWPE
jgi:hypothetical protein